APPPPTPPPLPYTTLFRSLVDLRAVAVEELDEARLRAGRAAHAPEAQGREPVLDLLDVEHEVLQPQAGTLADRGRLRRLEVRVAERRQVAVLARKVGERRNRCDQPLPHEQQRLPVLQQLRVVGDVCA